MTEPVIFYPRIAEAEQAIIDAGFRRDVQKQRWVNGTKSAKVMREAPGKFYIEWS